MGYMLPIGKLKACFLTHYHSDHIGDLGEVFVNTWINGRAEELPVYGGPGIDLVVDGFNMAYLQDGNYRNDHHSEEFMPRQAAGGKPITIRPKEVIEFKGGMKVKPFKVEHHPCDPSYGFEVTFRDRKVVISGDTLCVDTVAKHAKGCDLLVHEALAHELIQPVATCYTQIRRFKRFMCDIMDYHANIKGVHALAAKAKCKNLALIHLVPSPNSFLMRHYFGHGAQVPTKIVNDDMEAVLPVGSDLDLGSSTKNTSSEISTSLARAFYKVPAPDEFNGNRNHSVNGLWLSDYVSWD